MTNDQLVNLHRRHKLIERRLLLGDDVGGAGDLEEVDIIALLRLRDDDARMAGAIYAGAGKIVFLPVAAPDVHLRHILHGWIDGADAHFAAPAIEIGLKRTKII